MAITANHEITITREGSLALPPDRFPDMAVGETVRYSSSAGEVSIVFPDRSPFRTDNKTMTSVPGGVVLTLVSGSGNSGKDALVCRCFITLPNEQKIGWDETAPANRCGGDHHVK